MGLWRDMVESLRANLYLQVVVILVLVSVIMQACPVRGDTIPAAAGAYRREYTRILRSDWGLEAPIATLAGQIAQESGFDCNAVSRTGARGCAQFMPATAAWIGDVDHSLKDGDVASFAWAARAQAVYMKWLHDRVKAANACERMGFALQAYNSGLGWVQKRQRASARPGYCYNAACTINPGVKPANQREAQEYPVRIEQRWAPRFVAAGWGEKTCAKS